MKKLKTNVKSKCSSKDKTILWYYSQNCSICILSINVLLLLPFFNVKLLTITGFPEQTVVFYV